MGLREKGGEAVVQDLICSAPLPPPSTWSSLIILGKLPQPMAQNLGANVKVPWPRDMYGQVTQSRPFPLFLPGNWTLNTGTQGWKIYPNGGSLKESLINSRYPDFSGVLVPSGAYHRRFYTFSELSHVIPIRSLKGQFLLLAI